jgi:hypothetical protein
MTCSLKSGVDLIWLMRLCETQYKGCWGAVLRHRRPDSVLWPSKTRQTFLNSIVIKGVGRAVASKNLQWVLFVWSWFVIDGSLREF